MNKPLRLRQTGAILLGVFLTLSSSQFAAASFRGRCETKGKVLEIQPATQEETIRERQRSMKIVLELLDDQCTQWVGRRITVFEYPSDVQTLKTGDAADVGCSIEDGMTAEGVQASGICGLQKDKAPKPEGLKPWETGGGPPGID